jgi:hypothetical protein
MLLTSVAEKRSKCARSPTRALSKRLQRACCVRRGRRLAVEEHGGALDVEVQHLRKRLVQPAEHGAGYAR